MAARRKQNSSRRGKAATKSKRRAKRAVAARKSVKKIARRKIVARKRAAPKRAAAKRAAPKPARRAAKQPQRQPQIPATETVVVDTIEQPAPGVIVVTETEYTVRQDGA
jgi:hypothetical protein